MYRHSWNNLPSTILVGRMRMDGVVLPGGGGARGAGRLYR